VNISHSETHNIVAELKGLADDERKAGTFATGITRLEHYAKAAAYRDAANRVHARDEHCTGGGD
jgi:hypothetical protein